MTHEQLQRWRLILGKSAEEELRPCALRAGWLREGCLLTGDLEAIDEALELVYSGEGGLASRRLAHVGSIRPVRRFLTCVFGKCSNLDGAVGSVFRSWQEPPRMQEKAPHTSSSGKTMD